MPRYQPRLWIFGGANGSGKSTLYHEKQLDGFGSSIWTIDPDLLTLRIQEVENLQYIEANVVALNRTMDWVYASLKAHQTVGIETVLSTDKYRAVVMAARSYGHEVCFVYVYLRALQLHIDRVAIRVAKGGHNVPADAIIRRRARSLEQMIWFFEAADRAWVFDNSGDRVRLVARKDRSPTIVSEDATDEIRSRLAHLVGAFSG